MEPIIRENSLYLMDQLAESWTSAEAYAVSAGGHLITINDMQEYKWGQENLWGRTDLNEKNHYYIGFNDANTEGVYSWSSGESTEWDEDPTVLIHRQNIDYQQNSMNIWDYGVISTYLEDGFSYTSYGDSYGRVVMVDDPMSFYRQRDGNSTVFALAEIPLNLSITTSSIPREGAGVFTTSINLSAGSETSGNLAEGAEVYWTVSGITADDLGSGELTGSGVITNGKLSIDHSLVNDADSGETFNVSVFSDAEMTQQIGETQSFEVLEGEADPITGTLGLPGKVNLKSQGKTPFVLYGNEELVFDPEVQDSLINPESLGFGLVPGDTLFTAATKKNGTIHASYEDVDGDAYLDFVVKVATPTIASSELAAGEQDVFAFATTNGGQDLLFTAPSAVFF